MTREEAFKMLKEIDSGKYISILDLEDMIDKIFNDLEGRVCRNCKHMMYKDNEPDGFCCKINCFVPYYDENFGCNRFERREK